MAGADDRSIRAAIPDSDAAVEYLRIQGLRVTSGIDKAGTIRYIVASLAGERLLIHTSDEIVYLARNRMAHADDSNSIRT
jgi:hypothetical protein